MKSFDTTSALNHHHVLARVASPTALSCNLSQCIAVEISHIPVRGAPGILLSSPEEARDSGYFTRKPSETLSALCRVAADDAHAWDYRRRMPGRKMLGRKK